MALTIDDLFTTPDHYLHSFDGADAVFFPMTRETYRESIFLDRRIVAAGAGALRLPVGALAPHAGAPAPVSWIFHVAHCGSTLLSRALDVAAGNLALREPLALRQCAVQPDADRLALTLAMIGKRYDPSLPTVIKANVPVNFILPQLPLGAGGAAGGALFLYLDLADYLLAILRDPNHRNWLGTVSRQLAPYLGDTEGLTDAQRAAGLWEAQINAFAAGIARAPGARSLDAEEFFRAPAPTLVRAAALLGVPLTESEAAAVVAGPLFATYSKNPTVAFDNQARLDRRAELAPMLAAEIAEATEWLAGRADAARDGVRAAAL